GPGGGLSAIGEGGQVALGGHIVALALSIAVQNGSQLLAGYGVVGGKHSVAVALDDALGGSPVHSVGVPHAALHVGEGQGGVGLRLALQPPQDGDHHGTVGGHEGGEGGGGGTVHQLVVVDVLHGLIEPVVGLHVGEGQAGVHRGIVLGEGGLHSNGRGGHGEGVLAVTLIGK